MRPRHDPINQQHSVAVPDEGAHAGSGVGHSAASGSMLSQQRARNATIRQHAERAVADAVGRQQGMTVESNGSLDGPLQLTETVPIAIVPLQERALVPLPDESRRAFLDRLTTRIASTYAAHAAVPAYDLTVDDNGSAESVRVSHILQSGCALCGGTCCTRGGDHAFLGEDSLARVVLENAPHSPAELLAVYAGHLPVMHVQESCVYHGEHGCTLPRTFRSTTCNRYLCGGLTQLASALKTTGSPSAVIGLSDNLSLRALAVVNGRNVATLPFSEIASG